MAADTKRGAVWAAVNTKHNGVMLSVDDLREQLAAQGLHVVTAADKAVLDAISRAHIDDTQNDYGGPVMLLSEEHAVCRAELARRGAK